MRSVMSCLGADGGGKLTFGGLSVSDLAREYGTPLYLIDENTIRENCRLLHRGLSGYGEKYSVTYAGKALCFKSLYKILLEENMCADVVSGGELYTAKTGGFPADRLYFHGNNKTRSELKAALDAGVRRIVVDNLSELDMLEEMGVAAEISVRVKPGIDAHTHDFVKTGMIDSKFGVAAETGELDAFAARAAKSRNLKLVGLHCHIGSQIFETEPFELAAGLMLGFFRSLNKKYGLGLRELNLGGGFGIKYLPSNDPVPLDAAAEMIKNAVTSAARGLDMPLPELVIEPGRSISGPAGLTVYTVGSVKDIPGVNTYVAVDGGMTDNPRYALYGARYEPILVERPNALPEKPVIIAGRNCESGDIVTHAELPGDIHAGELLAIQATGAYNYSMASNYNRVPRPPVIIVADGKARVAVRRETYEDLVRLDV